MLLHDKSTEISNLGEYEYAGSYRAKQPSEKWVFWAILKSESFSIALILLLGKLAAGDW